MWRPISFCLSFQIKLCQRWFIKYPLCNKLKALIFVIQGKWEACCFKPLDPPHMASPPQTRLTESASSREVSRKEQAVSPPEWAQECVRVCVWDSRMTKEYQLCSSGGRTHGGSVKESPEGEPWLLGPGAAEDTRSCREGRREGLGGLREKRGLLLHSLPSVMHLPSGWQQAWSGVRWSEHGLSGAVTKGRWSCCSRTDSYSLRGLQDEPHCISKPLSTEALSMFSSL